MKNYLLRTISIAGLLLAGGLSTSKAQSNENQAAVSPAEAQFEPKTEQERLDWEKGMEKHMFLRRMDALDENLPGFVFTGDIDVDLKSLETARQKAREEQPEKAPDTPESTEAEPNSINR